MTTAKVLVTGASGLLGRAILRAFEAQPDKFETYGTAFSRASGKLLKVDLNDFEATERTLRHLKPQAEKRPDVVARDKEASWKLNVALPGHLSKLSKELGAVLIYISTDYLFDGLNPPYQVTDKTSPLNDYGMSKLKGEEEILKAYPEAMILRVPVLYGQTEKTNESAVNVLIDTVRVGQSLIGLEVILIIEMKDSSKVITVDDYHIRYPTCVDDVARVLLEMTSKHLEGKKLQGIFHFSSEEKRTKFEMCLDIGRALGLSTAHIKADSEPPKDPTATRPKDAHLSVDRLVGEGISCEYTSLEKWMRENIH